MSISKLELSKRTGATLAEIETAARVIQRARTEFKLSSARAVRVILDEDDVEDGRMSAWAARLRIFDDAGLLLADSDSERDATAPGETVVNGLPGAFRWACDLIGEFHPDVDANALRDGFERRDATLRVALSRGGGRGSIGVPYFGDGRQVFARLELARHSDTA